MQITATPSKVAVLWREPALAGTLVLALAGIVAASGVSVTAGGRDQRLFHLVTVMQFREQFPGVDIADVQTATAPLYHLVVAAVSGALHLPEAGTQFVAAGFAAALAATAVWFAGAVATGWRRVVITLPLLLSPYFWQSALWMLNDAAALLFAFLAFVTVLRRPDGARAQLLTGLLLAAAIATRQTYVWAVVPVVAVIVLESREQPTAARAAAVARVTALPVLVLATLVVVWHGFVPPPFREINAATRSWVSVSYCCAVAAMFLGPVLLAAVRRAYAPPRIAAGVATLAALPALVFPSAATQWPDDARRGGLIWTMVSHGPSVMDRSLVLAVLAALGAWIVCQLVAALPRHVGVLLTAGLVALSVVLWAGLQLHQKYFELPIAALALIVLGALIAEDLLARYWPIVSLAAVQLILAAGIVAKPFVAGLLAA